MVCIAQNAVHVFDMVGDFASCRNTLGETKGSRCNRRLTEVRLVDRGGLLEDQSEMLGYHFGLGGCKPESVILSIANFQEALEPEAEII